MHDKLCENFIHWTLQDFINSKNRRLIFGADIPIDCSSHYKTIRIWSPKYSINLIAPKEI
jgi:hypothetical protein